jgi:hypothetical protein
MPAVRAPHESRLDRSWRKFDTDEPDPTIQNDRLGRGELVSLTTVRGDANEVLDGNAESGDRRGSNSRNLVPDLRHPVGQAPDHISMGQSLFLLCVSGLSSPIWAICV